jgi:hypothetical protein
MTREEAAQLLLKDAHGLDGGANNFDPDGPEFFGLGADDPQSRAGISTIPASLLVAAGASLDLDLFRGRHLDSVALPTGLTSIATGATLSDYKDLLRYVFSNPMMVLSLLFTSSETQASAPLLSSILITPTRRNPQGLVVQNQRQLRTVQTTADFQANRATFPLALPLDGITYVNFTSDVNLSGADVTVNLAILIGKRVEMRKQLGRGVPVAPRPGGRGVAAV